MKKLLFTGLFALLLAACFAQKPYKVVFYNFENLFDTIRNPEIKDAEFTPEGPKKWNAVKYERKINNLSRVLFDIAAIDKEYPIRRLQARGQRAYPLHAGEPSRLPHARHRDDVGYGRG